MQEPWEYLTLQHSNIGWFAHGMAAQERDLAEAMNVLGRDGWELVGFFEAPGTTSASPYFKRPVAPAESEAVIY